MGFQPSLIKDEGGATLATPILFFVGNPRLQDL